MTTSLTSREERAGVVSTLGGRFFRIACWAPSVGFLALIVFATIASARVGHWPYYSNPDPKDLRLPLLHALALFSYPVAFLSIPTCLAVVIRASATLRRRDIPVFAIGASLWAFILPVSGRLLAWLVD